MRQVTTNQTSIGNDLEAEGLASLSDSAKFSLWPKRRAGTRLHVATLHRWATKGAAGVFLETLSVGATRYTSEQACRRFIAALTAARRGEVPEEAPTRAGSVRRRSPEMVKRLKAEGLA